jgi:hypothetical protein
MVVSVKRIGRYDADLFLSNKTSNGATLQLLNFEFHSQISRREVIPLRIPVVS